MDIGRARVVGCVARAPRWILIIRIALRDPTCRGNAVIEFWREVRVLTGAKRQALIIVVRVTAEHPVALLDAYGRGPVIEAGTAEVGQRVAGDYIRAPGEIAAFVEHRTNPLAPVATCGRLPRLPSAELTDRRDAVVHAHMLQGRILAWL